MDSLPDDTVELRLRRADPAGAVWDFRIDYVPIRARSPGTRYPWPRIKLAGRHGVLLRVRAQGHDRDDNPIIAWTFNPTTVVLHTKRELDTRALNWTWEQQPLDPARVQHILALIPELKWSAGSAPRLEENPRSDTLTLARQAKALLDEGRYSRLTDIADYLKMATTDEDVVGENPKAHRKAIRAAAEQLRRGLKRLEDLGET